ncbi:MAG: DUF1853 family protein [Muriicola sp.]
MVTLHSNFIKAFVQTPPLWLDHQFGITQFAFPEIDYTVLKGVTLPATMRLGHKIEHIFLNCLEGQTTYQLLAHSMVVRKENRTLGEIDFLLKDNRDQQLVHMELTFKFYLLNNRLEEPIDQLIGPNRKDNLVAKLEKLRNLQFRLPFLAEGKEQLKLYTRNTEEIKQEVCFKAQIFTPYQQNPTRLYPVNNHCVVGFWLPFEAFEGAGFKTQEYYVPTKDEWILSPDNTKFWMSHCKVLLALNIHMLQKRSVMVWMKKGESVYEKFFVVWW